MSDTDAFEGFPAETFRFLEALGRNNDRDWFNARRDIVERDVLVPAQAFVAAFGERARRIHPQLVYDTRINGAGSMFRLIQETDHYLARAMDPLLREVLFKPQAEQDAGRIKKGREKLAEELARFEGEIQGEFLAGEPSAADFAFYPILALALRVDLKRPEIDVAGLIGPRLKAWMQRVQALPCLEKTIPPHWKQ